MIGYSDIEFSSNQIEVNKTETRNIKLVRNESQHITKLTLRHDEKNDSFLLHSAILCLIRDSGAMRTVIHV